MTNPDREELVKLADELDGWHDCADGDVHAGNGHFRLVCVHDSEQQRLNLRATLRETSTALRSLASSDGGMNGEPEPVAWRWRFEDQKSWNYTRREPDWKNDPDIVCEPLYTAQPADAGMREALERYTVDIVRNAMLTMWNHICTDTDCHPLDIEHGRGKYLTFTPGHWAEAAGKMVRRNLLDLTAPGATTKSDGGILREAAARIFITAMHGAQAASVIEKNNGPAWNDVLRGVDAILLAVKKSDGGAETQTRLEQQGPVPERAAAELSRPEAEVTGEITGEPEVAPGPSEPSSTRSDVTVEELATVLRGRGAINPNADARALLDQFEIRRK